MSTKITEHFSLEEFACKDGAPYPQEWISDRLTPLCQMLEVVREACDHPVTVLCGYRSAAYNERLRQRGLTGESGTTGVAQHSQHTEGKAADITVFGMTVADLYKKIMDLQKAGKLPKIGGVGFYPHQGFCHVDIYRLPSGTLRKWVG